MTDSFSRLLAFPIALFLIALFTYGDFDQFSWATIGVLFGLVSLALIYVFNRNLDTWWYIRHPPRLERPLQNWLAKYSFFYKGLDQEDQLKMENRIAVLNRVKNFTLKGPRDFELEEDIKTIISHEFVRLTFRHEDYLFRNINQFIVYEHPFGSPQIDRLHSLEFYADDAVMIFSKEQLINGFLHPMKHLNIALLGAVMAFIQLNPRLDYPDVAKLDREKISESLEINLNSFIEVLGVDRINSLDMMLFIYYTLGDKLHTHYPVISGKFRKIFGA